MDEADLVRRCQQGDEAAFQLLVERYLRPLYGTAYLMTRDRALAEDLVQDTFLHAWRGIPSLRSVGSVKAWLVRILVRHVLDQRRQRVPEAPLVGEVPAMADTHDVEAAVLREEERQRIREALAALPEEQRQAVLLRYYARLTVPEIARALGWREGTVKSRLYRALERLRQALAGQAAPEGQEGVV